MGEEALMAETERLRVEIQTVADTRGAKEATEALNVLSNAQKGANAYLRAAMAQQTATLQNFKTASEQVRQKFGTAPTLGPGAFGITPPAAGGGRAGGGAGALSFGDVAGGVSRIAGLGVGLYTVHHLLQGVNRYLQDSIQLLREYTQAVGGFSTQVNALDAALVRQTRSGDALQITLGRLFAPEAIGNANALAAAAGLVNEKLEGLARFIQEHTTGESLGAKFWQNFLAVDEALPGVGKAVTEVRGLGKTLEEVDRDTRRRTADRERNRLLEINELPSRDTASELARVAYYDQVDAFVRDLTRAQQQQKDLQRESVSLAAQEAQIRLSMLPTAERLAGAQRDATEQQIRARQAALPASEALEDLQYEQQRARLIASNRGASVEERTAARRQFRALARAEPGVALGALEAGRPVTLAGRAVERVGLEQQLFQITNERALAQITLAQETNSLLAQIAEQRTQAIELTINMGSEQFRTEFHAALQVVQAHNPAPIPLVGTGP